MLKEPSDGSDGSNEWNISVSRLVRVWYSASLFL